MQSLREILHPTLFPGKPLPESARGGPPVRLQAKEVEDVCLRRLRAHDSGTRNPLSTPEGQPPLLTSPSQVLRQETLQIQQF